MGHFGNIGEALVACSVCEAWSASRWANWELVWSEGSLLLVLQCCFKYSVLHWLKISCDWAGTSHWQGLHTRSYFSPEGGDGQTLWPSSQGSFYRRREPAFLGRFCVNSNMYTCVFILCALSWCWFLWLQRFNQLEVERCKHKWKGQMEKRFQP